MMEVGIIGAGAMGSGIAQVAATAGHEVVLFDTNKDALTKASQQIQKFLNRSVEKGRITAEDFVAIFGRIKMVEHLSSFEGCDLVIEAIIENLKIKHAVFKEIESIVSKDCIIASNTSSLAITELAAAIEKPSRFLGIHFFNPPVIMKLVEIIPAVQTDPAIVQKAKSTIDAWGKITVIAKDTPGFIVNRIARPFYSEALRMYEEGMADVATIDYAMTQVAGFRMGPFTLMDYIGHDVNYKVTETVWKSFYYDPRYKPSFTQLRLSQAGQLGRKSGKGFYDYSEGAIAPEASTDPVLLSDIAKRITVMLINEAADALFLNIANKEDIELAMTKGVNYPKGLLHWADEMGIDQVVAKIDELYDLYREDRYRTSPILRKMANNNEKFFSA